MKWRELVVKGVVWLDVIVNEILQVILVYVDFSQSYPFKKCSKGHN